MIVVIASRSDTIAKTLVTRWEAHDVGLLTCEDLSLRGWRFSLRTRSTSTAIIGGQEVPQEKISGILIRIPMIPESELVHIIPRDRAYVAVEMTSFLISWLTELRCPILNRPTPACLSGPNWRPEQWIYAAAQIGMKVRPLQRRIALTSLTAMEAPDPGSVSATVIGKQCFGSVDRTLALQALHLAERAGVDLLTVRFSSSDPRAFFVGANVWSDITSNDQADAVIEFFRGGFTNDRF